MQQEQGEGRAEIYTYESPNLIYSAGWSVSEAAIAPVLHSLLAVARLQEGCRLCPAVPLRPPAAAAVADGKPALCAPPLPPPPPAGPPAGPPALHALLLCWWVQVRPDKPFRLAVGSFIEDYSNRVEILQRESLPGAGWLCSVRCGQGLVGCPPERLWQAARRTDRARPPLPRLLRLRPHSQWTRRGGRYAATRRWRSSTRTRPQRWPSSLIRSACFAVLFFVVLLSCFVCVCFVCFHALMDGGSPAGVRCMAACCLPAARLPPSCQPSWRGWRGC